MKTLVALVGTKFRGREAMNMLASLPSGAPLILKRDPDNEFDPRCIQVWAGGIHIGFIKKEQNAKLAARMDSAAEGRVNVRSLDMPAKLAIDGGKQPMVEIDE